MPTNSPGTLKDKFGSFGAAPTEQLWNSIESSLDQDRTKKRGALWWWFTGIAASGLLLFGIYYLGYQAGKSEINSVGEKGNLAEQSETNLPESTPSVEMTESVIKDSESESEVNATGALSSVEMTEVTNDKHQNKSNVSSTGSLTKKEMTSSKNNALENGSDLSATISPSDNKQHEINDPKNDHLILTSDEQITRLENPKIEKITLFNEADFASLSVPQFEKHESAAKWELGFSVGWQKATHTSAENIITDQNLGLSTDFYSGENTIQGTGTANLNAPSLSGNIARPFNLDFSIARNFKSRWSLKSRIGMNYILSETHYGSPDFTALKNSILSISIPVMAEFDVIKRNRFELSAGLGIMNEIPFYSKLKSDNPVQELNYTVKSFITGYMCSGVFDLGINYRLTDNLKLGLRPNLRHYFYQSMSIEYPVLERNTWFGANLGLVWEI
jgi:hypothetical protein